MSEMYGCSPPHLVVEDPHPHIVEDPHPTLPSESANEMELDEEMKEICISDSDANDNEGEEGNKEECSIEDFDTLSDDWMEFVTIANLAERKIDSNFPVVGGENVEVSYILTKECADGFLFDMNFSSSNIPSICTLEKGLQLLKQNAHNDGKVKFEGYEGVWDKATIAKGQNLFKARQFMERFNTSKEWLNSLDISNLSSIFSEKKANLLHTFETIPLHEDIAILSNSA